MVGMRRNSCVYFAPGTVAGETEVREVMKMPFGMLGRAALAMLGKFPAQEVSSNLRREALNIDFACSNKRCLLQRSGPQTPQNKHRGGDDRKAESQEPSREKILLPGLPAIACC